MAEELVLVGIDDKRREQNETFFSEESSFHIEEVPAMGTTTTNIVRNEKSSFLQQWRGSTNRLLKQPIVASLVHIATGAASRPMLTIIICVLISFGLIFIGMTTNFIIETQSDKLWEPRSSYPAQHKRWLTEESGFGQKTRHVYVLLHDRGNNVVNMNVVNTLFDVIDAVRNTDGWSDICGDRVTNDDLVSNCKVTSVTNFWEGNRTRFKEEIQNNDDLTKAISALRYPNGEQVIQEDIFGIRRTTTAATAKKNLPSSMPTFVSEATAYKIDLSTPRAPTLEELIQNNVLALNSRWEALRENYVVEVLSESAIDREVIRGIKEDIPLMAISFLIMGCFVSFVLGKWDRVKSQSMLGMGAVLTVGLSILSGYGLLFCIGVPFTPLTAIFPFVLLGIGLDDTFIIMGALSRADPQNNIIDRVADVFKEVGISIFTSTLTTVLAFSLGTRSSIPGVKWFALYAAPSVLIDFIFQITFFVALIAYDDTRMKAKFHDCPLCCRKGHPIEHPTERSAADEEEEIESKDVTTRIWLWYCENVLLNPIGKVVVLCFFTILLGLGSWGASQQSQQFDTRALLPPDSFVVSYFNSLYEYTDASSELVSAGVFFRDLDVSSPYIQNAMIKYVNDLAGNLQPYITTDSSSQEQHEQFWLVDFRLFVANNQTTTTTTTSSITSTTTYNDDDFHNNHTRLFYHRLDLFLNTEPFNSMYGDDFVRDRQGRVTASRTRIHFNALNEFDSTDQIRLLQTQYDITKRQPLNNGGMEGQPGSSSSSNSDNDANDWKMFTFGQAYTLWEIARVIPTEILTNLGMGLLATAIMSIILIPHPIGFLLLPLVVGFIYIELLGILRLANLSVNAITGIGLTISIGLVVDYNVHIVMAYFECPMPAATTVTTSLNTSADDNDHDQTRAASARNERVQQVVLTMGKSIFLCAASTLLGTLPLCFSASDIFWSFFVTFLGIVFLGASHGLILMPVLLSLFGPIILPDEENDNNNNHHDVVQESSSLANETREHMNEISIENSGVLHDENIPSNDTKSTLAIELVLYKE